MTMFLDGIEVNSRIIWFVKGRGTDASLLNELVMRVLDPGNCMIVWKQPKLIKKYTNERPGILLQHPSLRTFLSRGLVVW